MEYCSHSKSAYFSGAKNCHLGDEKNKGLWIQQMFLFYFYFLKKKLQEK